MVMNDGPFCEWAIRAFEKELKRRSPVARMKAFRAREKKDFKKVMRSLAGRRAALTRALRQQQVDLERRQWALLTGGKT